MYYRISNDELREMLALEQMSSKDIEETEEFKKFDKKAIIRKSNLYAEYDGNKNWKYCMQQFIVPYITFEDIQFPIFRPMFISLGLVLQMDLLTFL